MPNSAPPREAVSVIAQEFLVDDPCAISVSVPGAHTRLRSGTETGRAEVNISVTGCSPEKAEAILDRMKVGTRQMKDTVRVYSDGNRSRAEWWRWIRTLDVTLHVDVRVPSRVEAEIRAPGGEIEVAGLEGHLDLKVMGGPCHVEDVTGTLDLRAESSDVTIQGVSGDELVARVAVGALTVEDVQADTVTVRSVAAPLTLSSVEGATTVTARSAPVTLQNVPGPCTARVRGGSLSYDGTPTDEVTLEVVGASLDATLPSTHGAALTMTGPALVLDDAFAFEGERTDSEIDGTLNDGGPSVTLQAISGEIHCHSQ
jgi:hypothetical protein